MLWGRESGWRVVHPTTDRINADKMMVAITVRVVSEVELGGKYVCH